MATSKERGVEHTKEQLAIKTPDRVAAGVGSCAPREGEGLDPSGDALAAAERRRMAWMVVVRKYEFAS